MDTESPKRILFVISEDWYYWSHRRNIASAARAQGYDVWLATRVNALETAIREDGLNLIKLRWFRRKSQNIYREMRALLEMVQILRRLRPHIVHHVALKPVLLGTLAARLSYGPQKIVNALGGLGVLFPNRNDKLSARQQVLLLVLRLLTVKTPTVWVFQNASDQKILVDARITSCANTVIIPGSGADPAIFKPHPEPPGPTTILLASRLIRPKGIEEFIRAATVIKRRGIKARFAIAGPVDHENPLHIPKNYLGQWVRRGIIEYWGHLHDMPSALRAVHIFCLPTYYGEGIPKVLIEAAACGLPTVTTNIPGCCEIIKDGINGLTVPPQDVDALAAAMSRLINDKCLRMTMKHQARQIFLERFTDAHITSACLKVWGAKIQTSRSMGRAVS